MSEPVFSSGATRVIAIIASSLPILGIIGILIYTGFSSTFGVGLLAALGAAAVGLLIGLLFGVPKAVSSGAARQSAELKQVQAETVVSAMSPQEQAELRQLKAAADQQAGQTKSSNFAPSTNLAEVSDWLTKLLIGASLVSISKLGPPIGRLIDSVAAGLSTGGSAGGSAKVVAGAILFGYVALGFLDGYILTTVWYQRELDEG